MPPPLFLYLFLSDRLLSALVVVSFHTNSPSLSPFIQYHALLKYSCQRQRPFTGDIRNLVLRSSVLPPLFLSPLCLGLLFFGTCFSSFFCCVRETEVEQASKWMAKPPFSLLALLFMHVIPVPTLTSSPHACHYFLTSSSFFHLFQLLYTYIFLLIWWIIKFPAHVSGVVYISGCSLTLKLPYWPNSYKNFI